MVEYRDGDIFEQDDVDIIVHCANCFCRMRSGIAKSIREKYYGAIKADKRTTPGDPEKLGTYTTYKDEKDGKIIINLYGQYNYGKKGTYIKYEDFERGLKAIKDEYCNGIGSNKIAFPDHIGCGLAGGDWRIVRKMIEDVFCDDSDNVIICKLV